MHSWSKLPTIRYRLALPSQTYSEKNYFTSYRFVATTESLSLSLQHRSRCFFSQLAHNGIMKSQPTPPSPREDIAPVSLVWERQPSNSDEWNVSLKTRPGHEEGKGDSGVETPTAHDDEASTLVDVTWQLERQRRKVQHAQRVGRQVTDLDVVYQDEDMIIVSKPGGVLTVPGVRQHASLLDAVHAVASPEDGLTLPQHRIVHRLDMDTSGLVVFGRSLEVTKRLQSIFRERHSGLRKCYRAIVAGHWPSEAESGTIDLPLQRDIEHAPFMRVATPSYDARARRHLETLHAAGKQKHWVYQAAKPSVSHFKVIRRGWWKYQKENNNEKYTEDSMENNPLPFTIVDLEPFTGRTHQLRVHCAALGFPILGDPTYGWHGEAAPLGGIPHIPRTFPGAPLEIIQAWNHIHKPNVAPLCLHAFSLDLPHGPDGLIFCSRQAPFEDLFST